MRRFEKVSRLERYLQVMSVEYADPDTGFSQTKNVIITTAQADATSKLSTLSGWQVLAARPECHQSGDIDGYSERMSTALFFLMPGLGPQNTEEKEESRYQALLDLATGAMATIEKDISESKCLLLSGFSLLEVDLVPEKSVFGGWMGWSVELTFE